MKHKADKELKECICCESKNARGTILPTISKKYEQVNILDDGEKHSQSIFKGWEIHCLICGLTIFHVNKIDVTKAWNTRPETKGEVGEIVEILRKVQTEMANKGEPVSIHDYAQALSLKPLKDVEEVMRELDEEFQDFGPVLLDRIKSFIRKHFQPKEG